MEIKKKRLCFADGFLKWYERVKKFVFKNNGEVSHLDPALFIWKNENDLHGFITVHVDDFLYAENDFFNQNVVKNLKSSFLIGREEEQCFKYFGLNLNHNNEKIYVDQSLYIKNVCQIDTKQFTKSDITDSLKETD